MTISINFNTPNMKIQDRPIKSGFRQSNFVQKPDTFERNTNVTFTGKSNRIKQYTKTAETLLDAGKNAQLSLNGQLASEGWAGKVADTVSALWASNNRAHLVQADIENYNTQITDLKNSINKCNFK